MAVKDRMNKPISMIKAEMEERETWVLKRIWDNYDLSEWTESDLKVVREILVERGVKITLSQKEKLEKIGDLILSTTASLEGYEIVEYVDVVSSTLMIKLGLFSVMEIDVFHIISDANNSLDDTFNKAKEKILDDLRIQANDLSCNAIIGLSFNFPPLNTSRLTGVICFSATGTAVKVRKIYN